MIGTYYCNPNLSICSNLNLLRINYFFLFQTTEVMCLVEIGLLLVAAIMLLAIVFYVRTFWHTWCPRHKSDRDLTSVVTNCTSLAVEAQKL